MSAPQTVDAELAQELEAKLRETREEWERRLKAIEADRRRANGPLDPDFEEQAVERENDSTLDALDVRGRQELEAVESALRRLEAGTFGECARCGEPIARERLRARPTAMTCLPCAKS